MKKDDIESLRQFYANKVLRKEDLQLDAISQFNIWFQDAVISGLLEPNAMTLSTVSTTSRPSSRTVLFKGLSNRNHFTFYTNYTSQKGDELDKNPFASLLFCWLPLARQIRIEGRAVKLSEEESKAYFQSRPRGSQIGAWVSDQSSEIKDRSVLTALLQQKTLQFENENEIPKPKHWGGYEVVPDRIEFWQGNEDRLHDRFLYELIDGIWHISQLAP